MKFLALLLMAVLVGAAPVLAQNDQPLAGAEQQAMADTLQYALENNPTSQASDWVNPDTGRSGAVVPTNTYDNAQGQPCREFLTTIIIGGQEEQGYGTACRQPDGSWQLVGDEGQAPPPPPPPPQTTSVYFDTPPAAYYAFPPGFYGSYHIFLSFNIVHRSGHLHRGSRFLDGRAFRHRHPIQVRERVYLGPRILTRYGLRDEWRYREWERQRVHRDLHERPWRNPGDIRREQQRERRSEERHDMRREGRRDDRRDDRRDNHREGRRDDHREDRRDDRR